MCVLLLALGLLVLGSNLGCEAFFFGKKVQRGPCLAKNPLGPGFVSGTCMPETQCIGSILHGITHFKLPEICGYELLMPIVCCPHTGHSTPGSEVGPFGPHRGIPGVHSSGVLFLRHRHQGYNFGAQHGKPVFQVNRMPFVFVNCSPYVPTTAAGLPPRLPLPHGGSFGLRINRQGNLPVPRPHVPYEPSTPHGGGGWRYLIRLCPYPPGPLVPHGPVIPYRPTNPPGPVVPSKPLVPSGPAVPPKPVNKPAPAVPHGPIIPWRPASPPGPVVPLKPLVPSGPEVPPTPVNKPTVPHGPVIPWRPTSPPGQVVTSKALVPSGPTVPPTPVNKPGEGPNDSAPCGDGCDPGINTVIH